MGTKFSKLNFSGGNSNHKNCSYCNKPFTEELWCKECDPLRIMKGWTSGNSDIDEFIKDTIYDAKGETRYINEFLEWVPFDRFTEIKEIGEGGFAKVNPNPMIKVALKRLNGSQSMSDKYLNELKIHYEISNKMGLRFYELTKDPETKEFMMIIKFADKGNLRSVLSNNFSNIMWENFGLSGPANEQKSDDKVVYGVIPYIAPEVLNGESYTSSSDIYSLALAICNGLRPEFGKGTPEFYKKLAYKCMNANPNERPTAEELENIFRFWDNSARGSNDNEEEYGYKGNEIKAAFEEADKEIPNISTSYEKNSDAVYTSRAFTFSNLLPKPVNSSIITSYVNNEVCDSQLIDLEVSNSIQLRGTMDIDDENKDEEDEDGETEDYKNEKVYISDLELCQPVKSFLKRYDIYGVIPFMAPEVLRSKSYTPASDIYSFSMIMWDLHMEYHHLIIGTCYST
ncbi:kinase-like domain-containing protein [Rhizophagus diaphanus]|nr:kinase-like domain-containing protein [Rhizophagus diaphanus] [Rhizophagus sp. MUCL 43196]